MSPPELVARNEFPRSTAEARGLIAAFGFSIVLIGIYPGSSNGFDLLKRSQNLDSRVLFVTISAYSSVQVVIDALPQGACAFLTNPLTSDGLLGSLDQCLEQSGLRLDFKRQ